MKKFSVDFFSDSKYKKMTAEISFDGQILCQLNKDQGFDKIEMEFFHDQRLLQKNVIMKFYVADFLEILKDVSEELLMLDD